MDQMNGSLPAPEFTDLSEQEALQFKRLLEKFLKSYKQKPDGVSDTVWLQGQLQTELPHLSAEEAAHMSAEIVGTVKEYDHNLKKLQNAASEGCGKEQWLARTVQEAAAGVSVMEYGRRLYQIDSTLQLANEQMLRTVTTMSGEVSQCVNLDGYIAEQAHVNSFNAKAVLQDSPYRAEVCVPAGTYGKNSFDIVIRDTRSRRIVHQYQVKYGATAKETIHLLQRGNYNNQLIVVPPDQVREVQAALPGKTVVPHIGGTSKVSVSSTPFTKEAAKDWQNEAQGQGVIPEIRWNNYNTKELVRHIGENAAVAGMQGAVLASGFNLAAKVLAQEPIDVDETIQTALETGADSGIKTATAGALKVAGEKEILSMLPKGRGADGVIATMACVAIENLKTAYKIASGEISLYHGLDRMGQNTVAAVPGMMFSIEGAKAGAAAFAAIPIVGPLVGGLAGGMIGYMAGSGVGSMIYKGVSKVVKSGISIVKSTASKVIEGGKRLISGLFSLFA